MLDYAVIMAGGSGTRFWPLSRRDLPKQLLPLWEGRTLLELTVERLARQVPLERMLIVTGRHLAEAIQRLLPGLPRENLVLEPSARNTLPCIGLAVAVVRRRRPEAVLGIFSADHFVRDQEAFGRACEEAARAAARGGIATLGVAPTRPDTGFGYIRFAPGDGPYRAVERFEEKPDRATAERYLAEGTYLWNAGIFFFTPATFDREVARQRPHFGEVLARLEAALVAGDDAAVAAHFEALDATSIDYGIMEGARDVVVVPADVGWNDVGHWAALPEVLGGDPDENVALGEALLRDSTGCVVVSRGAPGKLVAVLGMAETVVVDTPDATLVMPRALSQRAREIVDALRERGRDDLT